MRKTISLPFPGCGGSTVTRNWISDAWVHTWKTDNKQHAAAKKQTGRYERKDRFIGFKLQRNEARLREEPPRGMPFRINDKAAEYLLVFGIFLAVVCAARLELPARLEILAMSISIGKTTDGAVIDYDSEPTLTVTFVRFDKDSNANCSSSRVTRL